MLSEVKLKDKWIIRINKWIKEFESLLKSLKSLESRQLTDQLWLNVKVPIIQEPFDLKGMFCFEAPKHIQVIGSYDLGTAIRSPTVIDIAIEIPSICWQRHDSLNQRYHRKRALYLSYISQIIKSNEIIEEMKFSYFNGNHMKPIILVKPKGKISKYCSFAIYAYPESDQKVFKSVRFSPEKNNVRSDWMLSNECEDFPTPVYNSSIQNDLNLISNYEYLSKTIKDYSNFKDSLILLKVWLKQREMRSSFGFVLSMFVCYLLENRKLSKNFSCYQIFRNTLLSISEF
jgi:U3 small nucleolar RNA-associated protein 22